MFLQQYIPSDLVNADSALRQLQQDVLLLSGAGELTWVASYLAAPDGVAISLRAATMLLLLPSRALTACISPSSFAMPCKACAVQSAAASAQDAEAKQTCPAVNACLAHAKANNQAMSTAMLTSEHCLQAIMDYPFSCLS